MPWLITPMKLEDGVKKCCIKTLLRTDAHVEGSAQETVESDWTLFHVIASGDAASNEEAEAPAESGRVVFGLCCSVTEITLTLTGQIEVLNDGYDWIRVKLNGVEVYFKESSSTSEDPWATTPVTKVLTLPITPRPCGNVIDIEAGTGDDIANSNVFWKAAITGFVP